MTATAPLHRSAPLLRRLRSIVDIFRLDPGIGDGGVSKDTVPSAHREEIDKLVSALVVLLSLVTFLTLYSIRSLDDNRLTSWHWVFSEIDIVAVFPVLVAALLLCGFFSRTVISVNKAPVLLFSVSFIAVMFLWDQPEMIVDTSRYFLQAKYLELYGVGVFMSAWGGDIFAWTDLPLIPMLYGVIFQVFGESRLAIQIFNTLLFSGTVVLTFHIGRLLWSRTTGLYAGLFVIGMPYLLVQVPLMMVDVPTMFFVTLAIFATLVALRQGGIYLPVAAMAVVLALLSKYSSWLMLTVLPVIAWAHVSVDRRAIQRTLAIVSAAVLPVGAFLVWKWGVVAGQLGLLLDYQLPGLGRWGESFVSSFFFQIHPVITLAALFATYVAIRKRDIRFAVVAWPLLLVALLEIRRLRYLIPLLPMLALMAAYGINCIRHAKFRNYAVASTVISAFIVAVFMYDPFFGKTSIANLQQAGRYLDSTAAERVEVVALSQPRTMVNPEVAIPLLDLYTKKEIVYGPTVRYRHDHSLIENSSLRFTWKLAASRFYRANNIDTAEKIPIVVIFGDARQKIPDRLKQRMAGYGPIREWSQTGKVFRYQTIVRVYELEGAERRM